MFPTPLARPPYAPAGKYDRHSKRASYEDPYASGNENRRRAQRWAKKVINDRERRKSHGYGNLGAFTSSQAPSSWYPRFSHKPSSGIYQPFSIPSRHRPFQKPRLRYSSSSSRYRSPYQHQYGYKRPSPRFTHYPMGREFFQDNLYIPYRYQNYSARGMFHYPLASNLQSNNLYHWPYSGMGFNADPADGDYIEDDETIHEKWYSDDGFENGYSARTENQIGSSDYTFSDLYRDEDEDEDKDDWDDWDGTSSYDWTGTSATYQYGDSYYSW